MRRVTMPFVLFAAFVSQAFGAGSLDDVAKGFLDDPRVQVELKVTPRQRAIGESRLMAAIFRSGLQMARAAAKEEKTTFKLEFQSTQRLRPEDLTEAQRRRARQIALQRYVLDSLLTSDAALALDLSPAQVTRLQTIHDDRSRAYNRSLSKEKMEAFQAKYTRMAEKADNGDMSEMTDEEFERMVKVTETMARDLSLFSAEMMVKNGPAYELAEKRALRVLTAAQRSRLRRLQGTRFST